MRRFVALAVLFLGVESLAAQSNNALQVQSDDGGSVALRTADGFMNQDSSLTRTWFRINDPDAPARLDRAGVYPRYDDKLNMLWFVPDGTVTLMRGISAIEVRYLLFDVWGQRLATLSETRLADSSNHVDLRPGNKWPALDSEATQLVTVVAFVARVRSADGEVWTFDADRMAQRIESLQLNAAAADLAPDPPRIVSPKIVYWTYSRTQKGAQ